MGDGITHTPKSAELARAKRVKEALESGTPELVRLHEAEAPEYAAVDFVPDNPKVQRAYLEQFVEYAPEAISIMDGQHQIVRVNGEFTRMFGYSSAEAAGKRMDALIVPPDRTSESLWITDVLTEGRKVTLETKRQRKDGTLVDVFISVAPVMVSGKRVAVYALYRDISDQKRAEALNSALYRIAEKASSSYDLQEFYGAIHAVVGELMQARNFSIALYDSRTEMLTFPYYVDEKDEQQAPRKSGRGLTEHVLRTGHPLLCTPEVFDELLAEKKIELSGGTRCVDWLGVPLRVGSHTLGVVAIQSYDSKVRFQERDKEVLAFVSQQLASAIEHKRNEEALRRSETRHRSLVLSAVYGIFRSSLEGKFLDVNPALIAMLGYGGAEEILALDPKHDVFIDPAEQARLMKELQERGRLEHMEVRWKRKNGNPIVVRLSGRAVYMPEEAGQVLEVIAEDVTERRALEEQFRQAQKMEAVGRLAGGVAHDFNNLLMVISGYTEVLLESTPRETALFTRIEAIQQAADRATTLTRQLLAFSRKQLLELKVVDVNAIVADMERLLRPLIGETIEFATRLAPDLGRTRADAGQIEQVIMNLVVNAKDAMPDGGRLTLQTGNVHLDDDVRREYSYIQPGPYVMLSIADTGHGMDRETQSRIFEPFFTTKEKGKGTGLGLSTAYGIIKQSGGYVLAESAPGVGTTFRIYLPRVEEAAGSRDTISAAQAATGGSETVLLVEDEESVRELVRDILKGKGYNVLEAENADAALRAVACHDGTISMLITDVVMPGMGGRELAKELCSSNAQLKVLFLSGYSEDAILEGVMQPGTAFLQKPFSLQVLARKVRELLREEKH